MGKMYQIKIFFIGLSIIVAISFASPTTTQIENPLNVDLLLESYTNKIHHLLKRQTSNRAIALANQLSGARGAPISRGGGSSYGRKRRQISSSIALANQLSGARGAPVSSGGSSYGRKRRQISSSTIALPNQLSGARGAPVSRGGSSYGRKRRSPGEFVVDDVLRDD